MRYVHPCAEVRRESCVCDLSSPAVVGLSPNGGPFFRRNTVLFSQKPPERFATPTRPLHKLPERFVMLRPLNKLLK